MIPFMILLGIVCILLCIALVVGVYVGACLLFMWWAKGFLTPGELRRLEGRP